MQLVNQRIPDLDSPAAGELLVVAFRSDVVGVSFEDRAGAGVFGQGVGDPLQGRTVLRSDHRAVLLEENGCDLLSLAQVFSGQIGVDGKLTYGYVVGLIGVCVTRATRSPKARF